MRERERESVCVCDRERERERERRTIVSVRSPLFFAARMFDANLCGDVRFSGLGEALGEKIRSVLGADAVQTASMHFV